MTGRDRISNRPPTPLEIRGEREKFRVLQRTTAVCHEPPENRAVSEPAPLNSILRPAAALDRSSIQG